LSSSWWIAEKNRVIVVKMTTVSSAWAEPCELGRSRPTLASISEIDP